jgi:ribose 1,5-bisphosphokinase PhnN
MDGVLAIYMVCCRLFIPGNDMVCVVRVVVALAVCHEAVARGEQTEALLNRKINIRDRRGMLALPWNAQMKRGVLGR